MFDDAHLTEREIVDVVCLDGLTVRIRPLDLSLCRQTRRLGLGFGARFGGFGLEGYRV